jgi:hypothetical protein
MLLLYKSSLSACLSVCPFIRPQNLSFCTCVCMTFVHTYPYMFCVSVCGWVCLCTHTLTCMDTHVDTGYRACAHSKLVECFCACEQTLKGRSCASWLMFMFMFMFMLRLMLVLMLCSQTRLSVVMIIDTPLGILYDHGKADGITVLVRPATHACSIRLHMLDQFVHGYACLFNSATHA